MFQFTMHSLLLTFDYELPLGGVNESYENSLFIPTEKLIDCAQNLNIPLVFFVDILCYCQFKKMGDQLFTDRFKEQVHKMIRLGHDVQLHLHPHWFHTEIKNIHFHTNAPFSLSDYSDEEILFFIKTGIDELNAMVREIKPEYSCIAYRAGGFNFGKKQNLIIEYLFQNGIRYDSSIAKGYYFKSDTSVVDYRICPISANWSLNGLNSVSKILEIPIASKPKSLFEIPTFLKLKWFQNRSVNRGKMIHTFTRFSWKEKWYQFLSSRMLTVDNYTFSLVYLISMVMYHIQQNKSNPQQMFALIGHPKSMGSYSLNLLEQLIKTIQTKNYNNLEINTFNNIDNLYKKHETY
jgi:hypothetical protein